MAFSSSSQVAQQAQIHQNASESLEGSSSDRRARQRTMVPDTSFLALVAFPLIWWYRATSRSVSLLSHSLIVGGLVPSTPPLLCMMRIAARYRLAVSESVPASMAFST